MVIDVLLDFYVYSDLNFRALLFRRESHHIGRRALGSTKRLSYEISDHQRIAAQQPSCISSSSSSSVS